MNDAEMSEHEQDAWREWESHEHDLDAEENCWCRPEVEVQINGAKVIIHNDRDPREVVMQEDEQAGQWQVMYEPEVENFVVFKTGKSLLIADEISSSALSNYLNAQQAAITAAIEALEIACDAEMLAWPEYRDKYKLSESDNGTWLNDKISAALAQLRALEGAQ